MAEKRDPIMHRYFRLFWPIGDSDKRLHWTSFWLGMDRTGEKHAMVPYSVFDVSNRA